MKAKDIKPGEVYAYRRSKYDSPVPVVFLAPLGDEHLYWSTSPYSPPGTPVYEKARPGSRPRRGKGYGDATIGYPVVMGRKGMDLDKLTSVTLARFEKVKSHFGRDVEYELITTLTHIIGPYEEVVAAEAKARAAEQAEWQAKEDRDAAIHARSLNLINVLAAHGVKAGRGDAAGGTVLTVTLDEADKLLALLVKNTEGD